MQYRRPTGSAITVHRSKVSTTLAPTLMARNLFGDRRGRDVEVGACLCEMAVDRRGRLVEALQQQAQRQTLVAA